MNTFVNFERSLLINLETVSQGASGSPEQKYQLVQRNLYNWFYSQQNDLFFELGMHDVGLRGVSWDGLEIKFKGDQGSLVLNRFLIETI